MKGEEKEEDKKKNEPVEDIYGYVVERISPEQKKELDRFLSRHNCRLEVESPISEWYMFIIKPTSVGQAYFVKCGKCGHTINLTPYEKW